MLLLLEVTDLIKSVARPRHGVCIKHMFLININAWPLQNVCIVRFAPSVGVLDFIPWNSMGDISDLPEKNIEICNAVQYRLSSLVCKFKLTNYKSRLLYSI